MLPELSCLFKLTENVLHQSWYSDSLYFLIAACWCLLKKSIQNSRCTQHTLVTQQCWGLVQFNGVLLCNRASIPFVWKSDVISFANLTSFENYRHHLLCKIVCSHPSVWPMSCTLREVEILFVISQKILHTDPLSLKFCQCSYRLHWGYRGFNERKMVLYKSKKENSAWFFLTLHKLWLAWLFGNFP